MFVALEWKLDGEMGRPISQERRWASGEARQQNIGGDLTYMDQVVTRIIGLLHGQRWIAMTKSATTFEA